MQKVYLEDNVQGTKKPKVSVKLCIMINKGYSHKYYKIYLLVLILYNL